LDCNEKDGEEDFSPPPTGEFPSQLQGVLSPLKQSGELAKDDEQWIVLEDKGEEDATAADEDDDDEGGWGGGDKDDW
jgi:hypothetical protein